MASSLAGKFSITPAVATMEIHRTGASQTEEKSTAGAT